MLLKHLSSNPPHSSHKQLQFVATTIEYESRQAYYCSIFPSQVSRPSCVPTKSDGELTYSQYNTVLQCYCQSNSVWFLFVFYLLKVAYSAWYWQDRFNESILSCCLMRYSAKYLIFRSKQEFIRYTNETSAKYGNIGINWFTAIVYICFNFQWWRKNFKVSRFVFLRVVYFSEIFYYLRFLHKKYKKFFICFSPSLSLSSYLVKRREKSSDDISRVLSTLRADE